MSRHRSHLRAFTLVEILAVVVILGIASAIIVPQIGTRDDLKLRSVARHVMADIIYAQNRAIATQKMHYMRFDAATQSYSLLTDINSGMVISHPISKESYTVRFAPGGRNGRLDATVQGVLIDNLPASVLAFDELGVPYVYDPTKLPEERLLPVGDRCDIALRTGVFNLTVRVAAYTGDVTVD
jgi:prepilin-type N-terminal cleavage/methylation domain-containing protein